MIEQVKNVIVGILLAIIAYLEPIEGELQILFLVFFLNFLFGYLSGMVKGEDFSLKKAFVCVGHFCLFCVICAAVYIAGRLKGQMEGAVQCVSLITYLIMYFYGLNILRNCKKIFKEGTAPWQVVNVLYFILRFKFIEQIPFIKDYIDNEARKEDGGNVG